MFMALSSWCCHYDIVIARVHPVHLMNADWAPGGRRPSDQTNRLGLWVRRKLNSCCCSVFETVVYKYVVDLDHESPRWILLLVKRISEAAWRMLELVCHTVCLSVSLLSISCGQSNALFPAHISWSCTVWRTPRCRVCGELCYCRTARRSLARLPPSSVRRVPNLHV